MTIFIILMIVWAVSILLTKGLGYFIVWLIPVCTAFLLKWLIGGVLGAIVGIIGAAIVYYGILLLGIKMARQAGYSDIEDYAREHEKK